MFRTKLFRMTMVLAILVALVAVPMAAAQMENGVSVEEGATLSGTVEIAGYAAGDNFKRWDLHLFPGGDDSAKTWVASGSDQGEFSVSLDTTQYADGDYTISLRVVDATTGNFTEYLVPVTFANAAAEPAEEEAEAEVAETEAVTTTETTTATVTAPAEVEEEAAPVNGFDSEDGVEASGTLTVTGFADTANFMKWQVDLAPAGDPDNAAFLAYGDTPGEFSFAWDTTAYPDGDYQLRLRVVDGTSNYTEYFTDVTVANAEAPAAETPEVEASAAVTETAVTTDTVEAPAAEAPAAETPATGLSVEEGATLSGTVDITGYAAGDNFKRWDLHLFPGGDDSAKTWVASSTDQGEFSVSLDTTQYADGDYTISLRVVDATTGNFTEYLVPVTFANATAE